jgi:DNA-binding MarR family transcriptional regulator
MNVETNSLYNLLKEVFLLLDDGDRRLFGAYALTQARFYALFHLGEQPGISSSRLSELMFCDKSNITRLIKGLESDGLVVRRPHETDGRSLRLHLTPEGEKLSEKVRQAHNNYNAERLNCCLTYEDQNGLYEWLVTLRNGLEQQLHESEVLPVA